MIWARTSFFTKKLSEQSTNNENKPKKKKGLSREYKDSLKAKLYLQIEQTDEAFNSGSTILGPRLCLNTPKENYGPWMVSSPREKSMNHIPNYYRNIRGIHLDERRLKRLKHKAPITSFSSIMYLFLYNPPLCNAALPSNHLPKLACMGLAEKFPLQSFLQLPK